MKRTELLKPYPLYPVPCTPLSAVIARNLLLAGALEELAESCAKRELEFIILKGSALLASGCASLDEREMTDIDILVRPHDGKKLEEILSGLGYRSMENSSQAFIRNAEVSPGATPQGGLIRGGQRPKSEVRGQRSETRNQKTNDNSTLYPIPSTLTGPPVIVDVHTELRYLSDQSEAWQETMSVKTDSVEVKILNPVESFIHACAHSMLHHGCLLEKTKKDLERISSLKSPVGELPPPSPSPFKGEGRVGGNCKIRGNGKEFCWKKLSGRVRALGLEALFAATLERLKTEGLPVPADIFTEFGLARKRQIPPTQPSPTRRFDAPEAQGRCGHRPRGRIKVGVDKTILFFFRKAAASPEPVRFLEYLLPVLARPFLALRFLFPGQHFLKKRYGSGSIRIVLLRPFRLIFQALFN
ncbi:MAG: nucleotidyltransferase family protein [bacterium]